MIDFEKELKAILENDPLDILKAKSKVSSVTSPDNRLKSSFEEINVFIDKVGRKPTKSRDIKERRFFSRLESLRESPEKAAMLLDLDKHNLLADVEVPEPLVAIEEIETVDDVLDADPLSLLGGGTEEAERDSSKFIWYACAYEVELDEDEFFRINTDRCYTLFKYEKKGDITFVTSQ